jgi:hypothetical protein
MPEDRTGMVEDQGISLTLRWPDDPTGHLPIKTHRLGRPCQDAAGDIGLVPSFRQHHAIRDDLQVADRETGVKAAHIDGQTPKEERDEILEATSVAHSIHLQYRRSAG